MKKFLAWLCIGALTFGIVSCGGQEVENNDGESPTKELPMEDVRTTVTDLLGDNYFPNQTLDPEALEFVFGITSDMYDDYFAEMPMISTNVDTLVVVKAAEGQVDAVEEKLNSYRDGRVSGTMEYPQNVGKIQASKVVKFDNYVIFTMLGGDVMDLMDQGDEAVITHCQEVNDNVIEAIKGLMH